MLLKQGDLSEVYGFTLYKEIPRFSSLGGTRNFLSQNLSLGIFN